MKELKTITINGVAYSLRPDDATIGKISDALDRIIALQDALIKGTITFTIDGTEYTAIAGMTWGEWVVTPYNTRKFQLDSDGYTVVDSAGDPLALEGEYRQRYADEIIAGGTYTVL